MPSRNDSKIKEGNYDVYIQFADLSSINSGLLITDSYSFRIYPIIKSAEPNLLWECCTISIEDDVNKNTDEVGISNIKIGTKLHWDFVKVKDGWNVEIKFPAISNPYKYEVKIPKDYYPNPVMLIGYKNPGMCSGNDCKLEVVISGIGIK